MKRTKFVEELAERLHNWYLEATKELNLESYNPDAQVPYKKLTEEQKEINRYIADRINCELLAEFRQEYRGKLKFKVLEYSTYDKVKGGENNMFQPAHVAKKLNELRQDGYEILWTFNTESKIELILGKEIGKMTPKERAEAEKKERNRQLKERGYSHSFNTWLK